MISNERQYKTSKRQLVRLRQAIRDFDLAAVAEQVGSSVLATAELQALRSEEEVVSSQIAEYEELRSGAVTKLTASSLEEIPRILIQARIAQQLTQRELAERIGLKAQQVQRYESSEYRSASLQRLFQIARALELSISRIAEFRPGLAVPAEAPAALDWSRFPVKEMYRRQWFEDFSGSLEAALREADVLVRSFVERVVTEPATALLRQRIRADSSSDQYALLAWQCRVLALGDRADIGAEFSDQTLDAEWISKLVRQSREPDGPVRARAMLRDVGIALVVQAHLPKTHLDGAALLYRHRPVIGMTLRYDRLDNFWFVLLHELFHVIKHLGKGKLRSIFDDLDAAPEEKIERDADEATGEALIPSKVWDRALPRYVRTEASVKALADELRISPAIISGRIRHEADNYMILGNLVGLGKVRKHFPEAGFGA